MSQNPKAQDRGHIKQKQSQVKESVNCLLMFFYLVASLTESLRNDLIETFISYKNNHSVGLLQVSVNAKAETSKQSGVLIA